MMKIAIVLVLTIVFELLAFILFIKSQVPKKTHHLWLVFIIGLNLFTNPLANLLYGCLIPQIGIITSWLVSECLVILLEAVLIKLIMRVNTRKSFSYSLLLNGTSIALGGLLWLI